MMRVAILIATLALLPGYSAAAASRPNVLMIFVDDLRPALGCYGDRLVKSPHIDQFAATARVFLRAYCHQAVCGPSRASILTGRLPDNTGVWHNRNRFRDVHPDLVTLPQLFKSHGWHAQAMGKVFSGDQRELDPVSWSVPEVLKQRGWSNYHQRDMDGGQGKGLPFERSDVPDDAYPDGKLANLASEALAEMKQRAQPFFLAVGFFKPHLPFNAPKKYWDLYDAASFVLSGNPARTSEAPAAAYPDHLELAGYRGIPADERVTADQARDLRHAYYACISYVDAQIGRVLGELHTQGLDKNTIVVLLGDHGYSLGEADHWCKDTNFELDTRVPLLVRVPGMKAGPTQALVEYVDLYPTLAALAELEPTDLLDGRSLVPVLENASARGRDMVLSQFSRPFRSGNPEVMGHSIRTESHRYTRWVEWKSKKLLSEELYDYTDAASVQSRPPYLIESRNIAARAEASALRTTLSTQLDRLLTRRVRPVKLESTSRKAKRKDQ
ncbi:MAG: sulfatase [Pirellulaceae bacterium]